MGEEAEYRDGSEERRVDRYSSTTELQMGNKEICKWRIKKFIVLSNKLDELICRKILTEITLIRMHWRRLAQLT